MNQELGEHTEELELTDGGTGWSKWQALATSWLPRLLIDPPLGSSALVIRPQALAHRSIRPLTLPAYTSVEVLKLKNNYTATATVYFVSVWCRWRKKSPLL